MLSPPTAMLVVVAAGPEDVDSGEAALARRGAADLRRTALNCERILLYGGFPSDGAAAGAVDDLRADGWPAVSRPVGGAHLATWQALTAPIVVGGRAQVCFPWSEAPRDGGLLTVEIDPGRGFGTGAHPTTRLLLDQLVERVRPGDVVLDLGTGSGVLAVVAARLGASRVTAVDVHAGALVAAQRNAQRNGVADRLHVTGAALADVPGRCDIIVANIFKEVLVELAGAVVDRLAPSGWLGLSGLSPSQVSIVLSAYRPLELVDQTACDDWVALVLRHPRHC